MTTKIDGMESRRTAGRLRRYLGARGIRGQLAAGLLLLGLLPAPVLAQQQGSGFNLFAARDFAATGMRSGTNFQIWLSNASVIDPQQQMRGIGGLRVRKGSALQTQISEMTFWATTGPIDYTRALSSNPSLQNAQGGGYTVAFNLNVEPEHIDWLPRDGALGLLHRGVRTPARGQSAPACLNHAADGLPPSVTLMAGSDCPQTWGVEGWQGDRPISFSTWRRLQSQLGSAFRFDFWEVPDELKDEGFLGNNFATFGVANDFGREVRERYGSVVQGGTGAPTAAGYPMGLEWKFDSYNLKSLPGVVFWQATVTNRSNEVYARGIDYDDLRLGFMLRRPQIRSRIGYDPSRGVVVMNNLGHNVSCDSARAVPRPGWGGTETFNGTCNSARNGTQGFAQGAMAVVFLKSPLGDLRNKQFSDPASAFYSPANPAVDDTITFNIGRACGETCSGDQFMVDRPRRAYGVLASDEAAALDGRLATSLDQFDYWNLFHPANAYPYGEGSVVDLANPRAGGGFNFAVPAMTHGAWDYNEDAVADTLFLDTCNPVTNLCTGLYSDSLPDRSINFIWKNAWVGAGPINLPIGATTSFVVAMVTQPDSASLERSIESAIGLYQNFFVAPAPPPAPRIAAAEVSVTGETLSRFVRFTLDMRPARWTDPFLEFLANQIRTAAPGTEAAMLRELNPWLADSLAARAENPIRRILVYKSCNPNATTLTYTTSRDPSVCERVAVRDTLGTDRGPAAYAQITNLGATVFTDGAVSTGQSYLYAFVPETRGARYTIVKRRADGTLFAVDSVFAAPTADLPTTKSAPNVAIVYIPASRQAGGSGSNIDWLSEAGGTTITTSVITELGGLSNPIEGSWGDITPLIVDSITTSSNYRLVVGDTIIIRDFGPPGGARIDSTQVQVIRSVVTGYKFTGASTARTATQVRTKTEVLTFMKRTPGGISVGSLKSLGGSTVVQGGTRIDTRRLTGPAGLFLQGEDRPLFASNVTSTSQPFTPNSFIASDDYNGVRITALARRVAPGTYRGQFYIDEEGVQFNPVVSSFSVSLQWMSSLSFSRAIGTGHGQYEVKFADTEFGPRAPFAAALGPVGVSQALATSLQEREVASRTATDEATVAAINRSLGLNITAADLADVTLPFTVRNASFDRPVTVAMLKSSKISTARFGSGADSLRVSIPANHWVPGERLIFLEDVTVNTVVGGAVQPQTERLVTIYPATISCGTAAATINCNPITGAGQSSYNPVQPGYTLVFRYALPFTSDKDVRFAVLGAKSGQLISGFSQMQLDSIKVVPNPYVLYSNFEQQPGGTGRIMFTHMPPTGVLRIYTVSGILVQEITWTEDDLGTSGDLFYDLRTREGTELVSGLYLFTVQATDPGTGTERKTRGRFIIIR